MSPWREVRIVERTGSTNADLLAWAEQGEPSGLVLVAREQTSGRGRLDRAWVSPDGAGLTFSVLLRTPRPVADLGRVPLLAGAAAAQAIAAVNGLDVGLKWPNDLVVDERKLGGLLVQHSPTDALVIGIGINTGMTADQRPIPNATSMALEGIEASLRDHTLVLDAVLDAWAEVFAPLATTTPWADDALEGYRQRCRTLGADVVVHLPSGQDLVGTAVDIDSSGALVVQSPKSGKVTVTSGDVLHVR